MTRHTVSIGFTLEMLTAFHIGTGWGLAGVVDERTARRAGGTVYVPGSSLKGRARYHFANLRAPLGFAVHSEQCRQQPCPECNLFGSPQREASLRFTDARLVEDWPAALRPFFEHENRAGVSISRLRGVAAERLLFATEVGASGLHLAGSVEGSLDDFDRRLPAAGHDVPLDVALLVAALRSIERLGGRKSRGLGLCRVEIDRVQVGAQALSADQLLAALEGQS